MNNQLEKKFLEVFFSQKEVREVSYILDDCVLSVPYSRSCLVRAVIMSPETKYRYDKFLEVLKLHKPLLFELR